MRQGSSDKGSARKRERARTIAVGGVARENGRRERQRRRRQAFACRTHTTAHEASKKGDDKHTAPNEGGGKTKAAALFAKKHSRSRTKRRLPALSREQKTAPPPARASAVNWAPVAALSVKLVAANEIGESIV